MNLLLLHAPIYFARGGGGGSGGGGGGSGGGFLGVAAIGYLPMHFLGAKFKGKWGKMVGSIILWPVALVYAFLLGHLGGFGFIAAVGAMTGTGAGLYGWFDKILKRSKQAEKALNLAAANDSAWNHDALVARVTDVFMRYQTDWSNNNAAQMQVYMTPWYFYHARLMILAIQQLGRTDNVLNPKIIDMRVIEVNNATGTTGDSFTMYIKAQADDQLVDRVNQKGIFRDTAPFQEFWRFERNGNDWLLAGIQQATANLYMHNPELEAFATQQKFCFSLDWGWLLLPQRGQLFGKAKFGTSDINNHVIGVYNDTLIQIYNYLPVQNNARALNYIIAQAALPKTYGNIVVRKKRRNPFSRIRGLTKVKTEWNEFNIKYEVWASDMERVTSFELLNPSYMVQLQELPFEVNIEVVDNIVYLYSAKVKANGQNYAILLDILYKAFKEMRM